MIFASRRRLLCRSRRLRQPRLLPSKASMGCSRVHCWQKRCSAPSTTSTLARWWNSQILLRRLNSRSRSRSEWHPGTRHRMLWPSISPLALRLLQGGRMWAGAAAAAGMPGRLDPPSAPSRLERASCWDQGSLQCGAGVCSLRWTVSASAFQPHCRPYGSPPALGGADAAVALAGAAAAWPACVPPPFPLGGSSCGSSPSSLMACRKSRHKSSDGSPCSRTPTSGSGAAAISGDILVYQYRYLADHVRRCAEPRDRSLDCCRRSFGPGEGCEAAGLSLDTHGG
mmetsp:Transcript_10374/g.26698  ORF Transcript_10374/g.26698 Transcript_10374/m.26698 type:complete len:283 (-) Transcript_10374:56-904(-)